MKTFCYFVVIFLILLSNIGLRIKAKFPEKSNPATFFFTLVLPSIIVFSCIVVAIDLTFKIINLLGG